MIVAEAVPVHPLLSVIVTVYVPGASPLMFCDVFPLFQRNEPYVPDPPRIEETVIAPSFTPLQVI